MDLSTLGGGGYISGVFSGDQSIVGGLPAGLLLELNAPPGKRIRLEGLSLGGSSQTSLLESNITLEVNGVNIVTNQNLAQGASRGAFCVSQTGAMQFVTGPTSGYTVSSNNVISDLIGETIKIYKSSSNTANKIYYSYSIEA